MKIYTIDGEKVSADKVHSMAQSFSGEGYVFLTDDDAVRILRCNGFNVKVDNVCGSLYNAFLWNRP